MGKRKSAKKPFKGRKQLKVAKVFDCPYCGNKDSVKCYIDKKDAMMATLACERCEARYTTTANNLTEAIDVFSEWIDACVELNKNTGATQPVGEGSPEPDVGGSDGSNGR
eukprot:PRCOL_00006514-RA